MSPPHNTFGDLGVKELTKKLEFFFPPEFVCDEKFSKKKTPLVTLVTTQNSPPHPSYQNQDGFLHWNFSLRKKEKKPNKTNNEFPGLEILPVMGLDYILHYFFTF